MTPVPAPRRYYDILGVSPQASPQAIREAWRAQVMRLHPDRAPKDRLHSETRLREINRAYAILKTPETRAAYDALLLRKATAASPALRRASSGRLSSRWRRAFVLAREILWPLVPAEARHGR